jgi:ubiquitin-like-conjugating enzyme ATG3
MSTRTTSAFIDKGVVSPEEFVIAGDFLVAQCPTWSWQGGEPKNARSFLPLDKQFLVTRNVPCLMRAAAMEEYAGGEKMLDGDDDGWVEAGGSGGVRGGGATGDDDIADIDDVPDIGGLHVDDSAVASTAAVAAAEAAVATAAAGADAEDDGDIPDMDDFVDLAAEAEEDEASALPAQHGAGAGASGNDDHILKTRTYDLSITYDKSVPTPLPSTSYTPNLTPYTPHPKAYQLAPHALHLTPYTPHLAPYTPHPKSCILNPAPHAHHPTLHNLHPTPHPHFTHRTSRSEPCIPLPRP